MSNELTVGSLFSGIGGIEIGFEKEGFKSEWFVEIEPYAQEVLRKRFPRTKIYEDITQVDFRTVPKIDILTGGFPCQDISVAGKQVGIEGSRSSLWKYYAKAIRILRPKFALIENVSALTIRGLNVVLADLAKIGYDAEWYNISASAVGAFHQRERIFIIAYPNSNRESDVSFNEGERQGFVDEVLNTNNNGQLTSEEREGIMEGSNTRQKEQNKARESKRPSYKSRKVGQFSKEGLQQVPDSEYRNVQESELRDKQVKEEGRETSNRLSNESPDRCGWWATEPKLGRVADGIPNRVDRIKCLGNAVVPQCAEVFAKAIKMKLNSLNLKKPMEVKNDNKK